MLVLSHNLKEEAMHSLALTFLSFDLPLFIFFALWMAHWAFWNLGLKREAQLDRATTGFFMSQCRDPEKNEPLSVGTTRSRTVINIRPIWWRKAFLWFFPVFGGWLLRKGTAAKSTRLT